MAPIRVDNLRAGLYRCLLASILTRHPARRHRRRRAMQYETYQCVIAYVSENKI
jgi:hypothetical protein